MTGVVLVGLLKCGLSADDPVVYAGLKFVEGMIDAKEGHLAAVPEGGRNFHKNYKGGKDKDDKKETKKDDKKEVGPTRRRGGWKATPTSVPLSAWRR